MPEFRIPYGHGEAVFTLPERWSVELLKPCEVPLVPDPLLAVEDALDHPVDGLPLDRFRGVRSAAVAVNDKTRPVPHDVLLPPLLHRLEMLGLAPERITLVIANGTHPPVPPAEYGWIIPADIVARYPIVSHDADDRSNLVHLGETSRGTPVWADRCYYEAELKIVVGNIEPHQFQGFSGGVKSAGVGVTGRDTINRNHSLLVDPMSRSGIYDGNPMRQDVEEIGRMIGVRFALNAILSDDRRISRVLAGDPVAVMRRGVPLVNDACQTCVSEPFDLVIAGTGGHPKDINLYQAQKALAHAAEATRKDGCIILLAACPQGHGSPEYADWMVGMTSHQEVLERFAREGFHVGPHKAFLISRDSIGRRVILVSQMPGDEVRSLLLEPAATVEEALASLQPCLPPRARVALMPCANVTVPTAPEQVA